MASGTANALAKAISVKTTYHHGFVPAKPVDEMSYKKEKKMGWFKRKFAQWSREAWEEERKYQDVVVSRHEGVNGKSSVRFTIYAASGGFIIEHYKQDRYRDSEGPELTIIQNGDSLGTAVEHILTLEALKS